MSSNLLWFSTETPDRFGHGGQRRQYFQIRALADSGHRVHVICVDSEQDPTSISKIASVERYRPFLVRNIPYPGGRWKPRTRSYSDRWDRLIVAHLESWQLIFRSNDQPGLPVLIDLHNVFSAWARTLGDPRLGQLYENLERHILNTANAVAICSAVEEERLPAGGSAKRIISPHGIDPDEWPAVTDDLPEEPTIALFGSWGWEPNKRGLDWFIREVWTGVQRIVPHSTCTVAGTGVTPDISSHPGVHAPGRVADLAGLLSNSRAVAVPVISGVGAAVKFGEALASGTPVIATPDAATAQPDAPAFVSDNAQEWVEFLVDLLRGKPTDRRAQQNYAFSELNWDRAVAGIDQWLRAAVQAAGSRRG